MPKADATGLAPEKSAEQNPPALSSAPEGFLLCAASPISMVKSRSGGLGHSNAKTARRALQILRLLGPGGIPPKPIAKLRNSPGNNVRISGGKSVTRYIRDSQPHEDRPPVVDQGDDPPHDLAALPVLCREACPPPLVLQLVEVVLRIAPVPVVLRHGPHLVRQRGHQHRVFILHSLVSQFR